MRFSSFVSGVLALTGVTSVAAWPALGARDNTSTPSNQTLKAHDGIYTPNDNTVWTVGSQVSITWNTSEIHNENGTLAKINLYHADDDYPLPVRHLATNFASNTGSFNLTVPWVESGCYIIKIKSYCGCKTWRSEVFKINNQHPHTSAPPPPPPTTGSTGPTSPPPVTPPPTSPPSSPTSVPTSIPTSAPTSAPTSGSSASTSVSSTTSSPSPAPSSGITSPNSNTVWTVNTTVTITFDVGIVKNENGTLKDIELYAYTSKTPIATLATNFVSNTGSVSVTVPNVPAGTYLIHIDSYRPVSWISSPFHIQAATNGTTPGSGITSPNSETTWTVGTQVDVTFDPSVVHNENGTLKSIELYAYTSKTPIAVLASNFASNKGPVSVTVPDVPAGVYLVHINNYNSVSWISDTFHIQAASNGTAPGAGITSPNSDTTWTVGANVDITFDTSVVKNENGTLRSIDLYAQTSKTPIKTLATNFVSNTGSVSVTVPDVPAGVYLIHINNYNTGSWISSTFNIQAASPGGGSITSPTAATTWAVGHSETITWDKTAISGNTISAVNLYAETAKTPVVVGTNVPNTGTFTFTVPTVTAGTYYILLGTTLGSDHFQITA